MEKIYFLLPNAGCAAMLVNDLRAMDIDDDHLHVIAKHDTELENLPEASLEAETDMVPAIKRGAAYGGATGLLAGLAAAAFPPAGIVLGGGALLGSTLAGATFGAWASSMIGISAPNSHLREYEEAIERGEVLMLVEVEEDRVEPVTETVRRHFPEVSIEGLESPVPPAV